MEKDVVNRYQSASQMLRHIYRIKKDPTTIFQKQTPAPRTPTAEVAIQRTTVHPEPDETSGKPAPSAAKTAPRSSSPAPSHKAVPLSRKRRTAARIRAVLRGYCDLSCLFGARHRWIHHSLPCSCRREGVAPRIGELLFLPSNKHRHLA